MARSYSRSIPTMFCFLSFIALLPGFSDEECPENAEPNIGFWQGIKNGSLLVVPDRPMEFVVSLPVDLKQRRGVQPHDLLPSLPDPYRAISNRNPQTPKSLSQLSWSGVEGEFAGSCGGENGGFRLLIGDLCNHGDTGEAAARVVFLVNQSYQLLL